MAIQNFRAQKLDTAQLTEIVGKSTFASTIALDVTESPIGDGGLSALAASPHTLKLKALWVDKTGVTDKGAQALASAQAPLEELYIGYNKVGVVGLKALLGMSAARFQVLRLSFDPIGDPGAALLATAPLGVLERLDLVSTGLTDAGGRAVLGSTTLAKLDTLDLSHNALSAQVLEPLLDPAHLPALKTLYLGGSTLDADLRRRVLAVRPNLVINTDG